MTGESGLLLAQHEKPPLIVLDLMLPGIDGWEITGVCASTPILR